MGVSQKLGATVLGVVLLGGLGVFAQNKTPGPDLAGIAQTKTMHADIIRAIEANTRAQIVIARLASQDARVAAAIAQVSDAQAMLTEATKALADANAEIRALSQTVSGQQGELRAATIKELSDERGELPSLRREQESVRAQVTKAQQALAVEQTHRNELSGLLDELERSLAAGR